MADFDFLDGFDTGGDWGFTGVSSKPSDQTVADTKATQQVVQQTADGVGKAVSTEIISRLETKLDKILREVSDASSKIDDKNEVEFEIDSTSVLTLDTTIKTLYAVISGEKGVKRNWKLSKRTNRDSQINCFKSKILMS